MRRHLVFVTTELPPLPGGAGAVVAGLAAGLAERGHRITVLLIAEEEAEAPPGADLVAVAPARDAIPQLARSRAAAAALGDLSATTDIDLVEFHDFDAPGFWALAHRADLGLTGIPLAVRLHGPVDALIDTLEAAPDELLPVREMERAAFAMADLVIAPSPAMAAWAEHRYALDRERVRLGEPPVAGVARLRLDRTDTPLFVSFGRLGEMKGSHDLLRAGLDLMDAGRNLRLRFVGEDGWSTAARKPMSEWLSEMIPGRHRDRIEFTGRVERDVVPEVLADAWAVVVPSRFESFSLAAHEARAMGLPLVVPDLPAFRDYWREETGAAVYDGSVTGLSRLLADLCDHPDRLDRLAAAPLPAYRDPLELYEGQLPAPRHPREQAGRATEAVQRLEQVTLPDRSGPLPRIARSVLRVLPAPLARMAVRVLPQRVKDRFRSVASWPAEQERRERDRRIEDFRRRAGRVPALERPVVTVVIPCFEQGEYLEEALASVYAQDYDSWEIVVVDDGSTEPATIAALDRTAYPRVDVVRQENRGLPAARNAGMHRARGDYLVPLDADDRLDPRFLSRLLAELAARPDAAYAHCRARLFGDVDAVWVPRPFNPYQLLLSNPVVGCVLLRADAWREAGGYDETMRDGNEDWELWVRLWARGWDQVHVPEPLFWYRRHGVSMSVATEARFEQGRAELVARHPSLYRAAALASLKADWYPLVSVLGGDGDTAPVAAATGDDAEVVAPPDRARAGGPLPVREGGTSLGDQVSAARGKYVIEWRTVARAGDGSVARLAAALEAAPEATAARPAGGHGPVLWRRWAVLDPTAAEKVVEVDVDLAGERGDLGPGAFPDQAWASPASLEIPVLMQDRDVEGSLPEWALP